MGSNHRKRDENGRYLPAPGVVDTKQLLTEIVDWAGYFAHVAGGEADGESWNLDTWVDKARRGYVIKGISKKELWNVWVKEGDSRTEQELGSLCEHASEILSLLIEKCLPKLACVAKKEELEYSEVVNITAIPASARDGDFINLSCSSGINAEKSRRLEEELLDCQREVMSLQKKVIELQDSRIGTITETVQQDLKSWSTVVSRNCAAAVAPPRLKAALNLASSPEKQSAEESEKPQNLMIFGLSEPEEESDLEAAVTNILEEIGEKPPLSSCTRVGVKAEGRTRPVRATLPSRVILTDILRKARELRKSPTYSRVYLAPDRTLEERLERRKTLETIQRLRKDNPNRQYIMRSGVIECV